MKLLIVTALLLATSAPATMTMKRGERKLLTPPAGAKSTSQTTWTSSNPHVASVINSLSPNLNGMVVAHKAGTVNITATTGKDQTLTTVTVQP